MAQAGCPVKKLTRTHMGPLKLRGLRLGEWRELPRIEVSGLRRSAKRGKGHVMRGERA